MASKRFVRLEREVEHEYRKKGMGLARARRIGRAVAGEVATKKHQPRTGGRSMALGKGHPRDCDCAFCRRAARLHRESHRHHHHRRHERRHRR